MPASATPGFEAAWKFPSAQAFKLVSFGVIACFVEVLILQGQSVVVAVSAAVALATCTGIGRGLAQRQRGHC
ncbi:hypothetical protein CFP71_07165 [Amycolatopsis thailandensis]|uniref:Uncharacterized protein n=1 Tax=Amycolatopsis thailandensis TaxID=589330 RepID=A0A229SFI3_9PSEU|nr:hypothetical protein [Amycolatopsis thailandensis]OXM57590.1 hypothetical protein CFP71_07165 [Amycolatopsis thailandensis]